MARIYNTGSVIESRLTGWLEKAFREWGQKLKSITSTVAHTGEGAWTVDTAKELKVEAKILKGSLDFRKQSGKIPSFAGKILSALRGQFGGHSTK